MATEPEVLLSVEGLRVTFNLDGGEFHAVDDVSFDLYRGETFSLVGESGSGKTTIGRAVVGLQPSSAGTIQFKGEKINGKLSRRKRSELVQSIQMIFQDPAASLNERATVEYVISEGLYNFRLYKDDADRRRKVTEMITEVGLLPEHLGRYSHEFSGGQRQRIGIARALVMEPELVVADEPISALDVSVRAQVLNLLKRMQREQGLTYLFVAHDLSVVRFISDRIGVINHGHLVELATAEELFRNPLHPYTQSLLSAIPIPDPHIEKNKQLVTFTPADHDDVGASFVEISPGHFVRATPEQADTYRSVLAETA
ncbi:MAG: ATP-binding cassette domain-containing protein [Microbacterium sp.]